MGPNELNTWVRAVPFVPFRVRMNSGRTFDVRHPEVLRVGLRSLHLFTYSGDATDIYEKVEMLSPLLVESVEPIDSRQPN
jgi:hypothetical protein